MGQIPHSTERILVQYEIWQKLQQHVKKPKKIILKSNSKLLCSYLFHVHLHPSIQLECLSVCLSVCVSVCVTCLSLGVSVSVP